MSTSLDNIYHKRDIIAWFEIPALNFERAVKFYRESLSLQVQVIEFNSIRHGVIRNRHSAPKGSIVEQTEVKTGGGPLLYFRAEYDVSTTLENIRIAGGKVLKEKTLIRDQINGIFSIVPFNLIDDNVGYYAIFEDTEGNVSAIYNNS